jgi:ATP adenylyltransferase
VKPIFAPWRMAYIAGGNPPGGCLFCELPPRGENPETLVVHRGQRAYVVLNRFPYTTGHLMVVPYRHVDSPDRLDPGDWVEVGALVARCLRALKAEYRPQGFNVGINVGRAAGAGIEDHCHLHVVPRWNGDNNFVPVLSEARVIPEALDETWRRLTAAFAAAAQEEGTG